MSNLTSFLIRLVCRKLFPRSMSFVMITRIITTRHIITICSCGICHCIKYFSFRRQNKTVEYRRSIPTYHEQNCCNTWKKSSTKVTYIFEHHKIYSASMQLYIFYNCQIINPVKMKGLLLKRRTAWKTIKYHKFHFMEVRKYMWQRNKTLQ